MAIKKWAYIFLSPGFSPETHTSIMKSDSTEMLAIGLDMSRKEDVVPLAQKLVADGVQFIELCGGFGPIWIARITDEMALNSQAAGREVDRHSRSWL